VLLPFDNLPSSLLTHPDHQTTFQATLGPGRSAALTRQA
jgi:hypothetical protein